MSEDGAPKACAPTLTREKPENLLPCICGGIPERDAFDRYTVYSYCRCPDCGRAQIAKYDSRGADVFAWNKEMCRIRGLIDAYPSRDECEANEAEFLAVLSEERASLVEAHDYLMKAQDVLITRAPLLTRKDMMHIVEEIDLCLRTIRRDIGWMPYDGAVILSCIQKDNAKKKAEAEKDGDDE